MPAEQTSYSPLPHARPQHSQMFAHATPSNSRRLLGRFGGSPAGQRRRLLLQCRPNARWNLSDRLPVNPHQRRAGDYGGLVPSWMATTFFATIIGCGAPAGPLVLPPEAASVVTRALARMGPELRFEDGRIEYDHAVARLCSTGDEPRCFALLLSDPSTQCDRHWGGFCVGFPDGPPDAAALGAIERGLRAETSPSVWSHPPAPPAPKGPLVPRWARPLAIALLELAFPLAAGLLIGVALRRGLGRRVGGSLFPLACLALPAAIASLVTPGLFLIGMWDAWIMAICLGAGMVLAAHRTFAQGRDLALLAGAVFVSLAALEVGSRVALPPPPAFPTKSAPRFLMFDRSARVGRLAQQEHAWTSHAFKERICQAIYGEGWPEPPDRTVTADTYVPRAGAHRRVLHLGDSMVFGSGVEPSETFVANLALLEPDTEHINSAVAGAGPDSYLAILSHWLERQSVDLVVMHIFSGNDLVDLDAPLPCCAWGPVLSYAPEGAARLRYPTPVTASSAFAKWRAFVHESPPPYPIRFALRFSRAAAHLATASVRLSALLGDETDESTDTRFAHYEAIVRTARDWLRERNIPLVVVILPARAELEAVKPTTHLDYMIENEMARRSRALGVPTLWARDPFAAALEGGATHLFADELGGPTDPHFSVEGHLVAAHWLHQQLALAVDGAGAQRAAER